jgi:hypothetical protein
MINLRTYGTIRNLGARCIASRTRGEAARIDAKSDVDIFGEARATVK